MTGRRRCGLSDALGWRGDGHHAAGCFVVEDDTVEVVLESGEPIERGPGDVIGELSVLADTVRSARVTAVPEAQCLAISRDDVLTLLDGELTIAVTMLEAVARRLIDVT